MPCCIYTYHAYCVYVLKCIGMCGIQHLVICFGSLPYREIPPSASIRNTWIDRHVSFFAPVSVPMGKCHAVFTEVLVACYDLVTHAADRHVHCWVMYACPYTFVPPWFMTSHVDLGSLPYGC